MDRRFGRLSFHFSMRTGEAESIPITIAFISVGLSPVDGRVSVEDLIDLVEHFFPHYPGWVRSSDSREMKLFRNVVVQPFFLSYEAFRVFGPVCEDSMLGCIEEERHIGLRDEPDYKVFERNAHAVIAESYERVVDVTITYCAVAK